MLSYEEAYVDLSILRVYLWSFNEHIVYFSYLIALSEFLTPAMFHDKAFNGIVKIIRNCIKVLGVIVYVVSIPRR